MKATEKADFFRQTAKQINEIEGNTIKMDLVVKHFSNLTVEELFEIYKLRVSVFVVEQNCPYQEIDDADKVAYHVFLKDEAGIQAYVRVLPQGATFPEASIGQSNSRSWHTSCTGEIPCNRIADRCTAICQAVL